MSCPINDNFEEMSFESVDKELNTQIDSQYNDSILPPYLFRTTTLMYISTVHNRRRSVYHHQIQAYPISESSSYS
jgi:hypothetical protein